MARLKSILKKGEIKKSVLLKLLGMNQSQYNNFIVQATWLLPIYEDERTMGILNGEIFKNFERKGLL